MAGLIQSLDPELGPRVHRLWASWFFGKTGFSPESVSQADVFSLLRTLLLSGSPSPPFLLFPPGALKSGRSCSRRAQLCRVAEMLVGRLRITLLTGAAVFQSCRGAAAGARVGGRSARSVLLPGADSRLLPQVKASCLFSCRWPADGRLFPKMRGRSRGFQV